MDFDLVSALIVGIVSSSAGWAYYFLMRSRIDKTLPDYRTLDTVPTPLAICNSDGCVAYCNPKFASDLRRRNTELLNKPISEVFELLGASLSNEGALTTALEDWNVKFRTSLEDPEKTYRCPPFRFGIESEKIGYHSFWFHTRKITDRYKVFFGINYLRSFYRIDSTIPQQSPWQLEVDLQYRHNGAPLRFSPSIDLLRQIFSRLSEAGPYVCVGSSAVRIHSNDYDKISSLDIVTPGGTEGQNRFTSNLDQFLEGTWEKIEANVGSMNQTHWGKSIIKTYVTADDRTGLKITLFKDLGKWNLDVESIVRRRTVVRGRLSVRFPSVEDSIVTYLSLDKQKATASIHSKALRELVRAIVVDGEQLHRDELEGILDRRALDEQERKAAGRIFDRISFAATTVTEKYSGRNHEKFNAIWEDIENKGIVPKHLLD